MIFTFQTEIASWELCLPWLSAVFDPVATLEILLKMLFLASGTPHSLGFPLTSQAAPSHSLLLDLLLSLPLDDGVPWLSAQTALLLPLEFSR